MKRSRLDPKALSVLVAIGACILGNACSSTKEPQTPAQPTMIGSGSASMYALPIPVGTRMTYVSRAGVTFCAEPYPDTAIQEAIKFANEAAVGVKAVSVSDKLSYERANQVIQLAGRTQMVLMTRELLYRLCESGDRLTEADINHILCAKAKLESKDPTKEPDSCAKAGGAKNNTALALLYLYTIDAIVKLAEADKAQSKAAETQAAAAKLEAQAKIDKLDSVLDCRDAKFACVDKAVTGETQDDRKKRCDTEFEACLKKTQ